MILLLSLVFGVSMSIDSSLAASSVELPFRIEGDAVCFRNGDPDLGKTGIPILGNLGVKKGVCQGIASISAAFRENAEFVPSADRDSAPNSQRTIASILNAHANRKAVKFMIPGFDSLGSFCRAHRMDFLRNSVWENTSISISRILPYYPEFIRVKKQPIKFQRDSFRLRKKLGAALAQVHSELTAGKYPLLLYFSHVVMVRGYREIAGESGTQVELEVYDSNHLETLRKITVQLDSDGFPSGENPMYWVVTP